MMNLTKTQIINKLNNESGYIGKIVDDVKGLKTGDYVEVATINGKPLLAEVKNIQYSSFHNDYRVVLKILADVKLEF